MSGGQRLTQFSFAGFQLGSCFLATAAAFVGNTQAVLASSDQSLSLIPI